MPHANHTPTKQLDRQRKENKNKKKMFNYIMGAYNEGDSEVPYVLMEDIDYEGYWDSVPLFARDPGNKCCFLDKQLRRI